MLRSRLSVRKPPLALPGRADVVVEFGPEPHRVEDRRGRRNPRNCGLIQLCAQALCLEERLDLTDRSGRRSIALDRMEEWRTPIADVIVFTLINRLQLHCEGFAKWEEGGVILEERLDV